MTGRDGEGCFTLTYPSSHTPSHPPPSKGEVPAGARRNLAFYEETVASAWTASRKPLPKYSSDCISVSRDNVR